MTDNTTTAPEAVRDAQQLTSSTHADIRDRTSSNHTSSNQTSSTHTSSTHTSSTHTSSTHTSSTHTSSDDTSSDDTSPDATSSDPTTADNATPDAVAPRQVFPLPRELRDIIYGHLLDAEQVVAPCSRDVRVARAAATGQPVETHPHDVSLAHTYEFHTNILAVNKTINEEAKKVFRKNNFVLTDVWWPNISSTLHELDVPVICEDNKKSLLALRYASLVFTVTHPDPMDGDPTNRMVLAGRDFPIFRRAMRWTFKQLKTTVELTISGNDNPGRTFTILMGGNSPQIIKTGILITDKDFLTKHAKIFIPEIKTMSVPGQEVKVFLGGPQGFNQAASQFIENDMSRKTFDVEMFITDCLQGTMLVRKAAEEMASKGVRGQKLAVVRYTNIIRA
ncbi:hypothetical protein M409DRAFT_21787 [Zasmidium cellare ATCC 36951]|uniref:F-box domain-containing protein n=1 Tax=Zasmidium cellare ATCC 36951 TaxID=1080233 RepID=A0A6A6CNX0_ZASCE|nr:uncharacterized protein M409DRAFT_21787 [Zasmidium cellare ATCC 36951]KAF2168353.1 hypothetical protein M409DRAFT_21787 [Zasmidium cellare ATCC 36951]